MSERAVLSPSHYDRLRPMSRREPALKKILLCFVTWGYHWRISFSSVGGYGPGDMGAHIVRLRTGQEECGPEKQAGLKGLLKKRGMTYIGKKRSRRASSDPADPGALRPLHDLPESDLMLDRWRKERRRNGNCDSRGIRAAEGKIASAADAPPAKCE